MSFSKMRLTFLLGAIALTYLYSGSNEKNDPGKESTHNQERIISAKTSDDVTGDITEEESPQGDITNSDITFELYTQHRKTPVSIPGNNQDSIAFTDFSVDRKSVFLIHGWRNDNESDFNVLVTKAILDVYNVNLFQVVWSDIAKRKYRKAKHSVKPIGYLLGFFIDHLLKKYNLDPSDFILIGHSLGAHIAGHAGAQVKSLNDKYVDSIIALDPAGPLFYSKIFGTPANILHADFVHVIHTNGGVLGYAGAIGNADYYPNGGTNQPGCGFDLTGHCAHSRSYEYFAESIYRSEFLAQNCDEYRSYVKGECDNNHVSRMGGLYVDKSASGIYYLNTNEEPPYAIK